LAVSDNLEINLQNNNPQIIVKPTTIKIERDRIKEDFVIKQVELFSKEAGNEGEIIAVSERSNHSSKVGVKVSENPIFSPQNGFAFVPDRTKIVDGGEKKYIYM